jgi:hypothetical protein
VQLIYFYLLPSSIFMRKFLGMSFNGKADSSSQ